MCRWTGKRLLLSVLVNGLALSIVSPFVFGLIDWAAGLARFIAASAPQTCRRAATTTKRPVTNAASA